jgi:hypothetical protein
LIDSVAQEADQGIADIVEGQALEGRSTEILIHIFENWAITAERLSESVAVIFLQ